MSSIVTLGYSNGVLLVPLGYGGHLNIIALAQLGSNAINVLPGTRILGFGVLTVNGKVVTSPVTLNEEGYYVVTATEGSISATLNVAVVIPDTTQLQILDIIGPATTTGSFQNLTNTLTTPLGKFANCRPAVLDTECQLLLSTNKAVFVSIRSVDDLDNQTEIGRVSATMAGRWLTSELVLPQGLNNTKLVIPINLGDQIIGTLTPPYVPPTPVVPTTNPVILLPSALQMADDQEFTPSAGTYANSYSLVDTNDSDTSYVTLANSQQWASWKLGNYTPSGLFAYIYSVTLTAISRRVDGGSQSAVVWGPYLKNTNTSTRYFPDMALEPSDTYQTHSITLLLNPFTGVPWQPGDLQTGYIHLGVQRDASLDAIRCTLVSFTVNEVLT